MWITREGEAKGGKVAGWKWKMEESGLNGGKEERED
jgi:hypothetical protein